MEFQRLLLQVEQSLSEPDTQAIAFLCVDLLGRDLSSVSCKELFNLLVDNDLLSSENTFLLTELLHTCKRHDLIRRLGLQTLQQPGESLIGPYRKLLFSLSENITDPDLKNMKFLLRATLRRKKLDKMTTLELLQEMEKEDLLSSENLEDLKSILDQFCPILAKTIDMYKQETNHISNHLSNQVSNIGPISQETAGGKMSTSEMVAGSHKDTSSPHLCNVPSDESLSFLTEELENLSVFSGTDSEVQSLNLAFSSVPGNMDLEQGSSHSSISAAAMDLPKYAMKGDKRGVCLIINNHDFSKSVCDLKNRDGTQFDEARLKEVFGWLGFDIEVCRDCSREKILSLLEEMRQRDHSQVDCFVCCVLSHGLMGTVYGVDGTQVKLRELTERFSGHSCPSLTEKPKLFFIQACQGSKEQPITFIQSDGPRPRSLTTDALVPRNSIPADADFLLGMATIPEYASFRDKKEGTWYIQSLCEMLQSLVPKGIDLLSILTEVNNDVSKKASGSRKQMPQPVYTLRKRVIFPIPSHTGSCCPEQTSL